GGDQGLGEGGLDLPLDQAVVPGRGTEELLQGPNLAIAQVQGDGFGVLAAFLQEQAAQVGQGMALGGLVAEQRGEALVQFGQVTGGGADLVRGHEGVLLTAWGATSYGRARPHSTPILIANSGQFG